MSGFRTPLGLDLRVRGLSPAWGSTLALLKKKEKNPKCKEKDEELSLDNTAQGNDSVEIPDLASTHPD